MTFGQPADQHMRRSDRRSTSGAGRDEGGGMTVACSAVQGRPPPLHGRVARMLPVRYHGSMSVNIRDLAVLRSASERLAELIQVCRVRGPIYCHDPALSADVTRKAKSLATSLATLQAALDDPDHKPGKE